jgi:serine/threonine protein kinase
LPSNENIVKFEDCFFDQSNCFYLVLEYCDGGDLKDRIENKVKFPNETIIKWSKEILLGIDYLHFNKIVHRDIKPANILLKNNQIKIGDLGSVKNLNESIVRTFVGTPLYRSPEMIRFKNNKRINITTKTDIWSIGLVIYELLTLKRLFKQTNSDKLMDEILNFDSNKFELDVNDQFLEDVLKK